MYKNKSKINTYIFGLFLIALISFAIYSCRVDNTVQKDVIRIKGSDTMLNLSLMWAEKYMQENSRTSIQVSGGGSETGLAALLNGSVKVANISRRLTGNEIQTALKKGVEPVANMVAEDAIVIAVHIANKIDSLTVAELKKIYSGHIKNWKEVGGDNKRIILYGREKSSGTYEIFRNSILNEAADSSFIDYYAGMKVLQGTAAIAEAVANDKFGIGFGGMGYFASRKDVKVLSIKINNITKAVSPLKFTSLYGHPIHPNNYPLSRKLYCYTNGKPQGDVKKFIDFIVSSNGQKIVEQMEFIPLTFSGE
ncbi:MAG: phosphate ABC transporter substrate-binding protein [Bacteroidetes bacterium]|nr:phosphate ABC transporter substrate-binding protein [Bacteroidota bacterium]